MARNEVISTLVGRHKHKRTGEERKLKLKKSNFKVKFKRKH